MKVLLSLAIVAMVAAAIILLVSMQKACDAKGGKLVRGVIGLECIKTR